MKKNNLGKKEITERGRRFPRRPVGRIRPVTGAALALAFWLAACFPPSPAHAHEAPPTFDRINLSAGASTEVDNDWVVVTLYRLREGTDAAALTDAVNRDVAEAARRAKSVPGVKVQTLGHQVSPVYRQNRLSGWRVQQSLRLEGGDFAAMGTLAGALSETLTLGGVTYDVSPAARAEAENALIRTALAAFRERADLVTRELGRREYRLVQLDVGTRGVSPGPRVLHAAVAEMRVAEVAPPALEGGTQTLSVEVTGTIELAVDD